MNRCKYCHTPLIITYDTKLPMPVKVNDVVIKRAKATKARGHVLYWKQRSGEEPIAIIKCPTCGMTNVFGLPNLDSKVLEVAIS